MSKSVKWEYNSYNFIIKKSHHINAINLSGLIVKISTDMRTEGILTRTTGSVGWRTRMWKKYHGIKGRLGHPNDIKKSIVWCKQFWYGTFHLGKWEYNSYNFVIQKSHHINSINLSGEVKISRHKTGRNTNPDY